MCFIDSYRYRWIEVTGGLNVDKKSSCCFKTILTNGIKVRIIDNEIERMFVERFWLLQNISLLNYYVGR